jgi:hypothetical protein
MLIGSVNHEKAHQPKISKVVDFLSSVDKKHDQNNFVDIFE